MAETHVISALVEKYRVISGQIEACESELAKHRWELDNIKSVIRMFEPDYDLRDIQPKKTIKFTFKRNIFMRCAMDILREAKEPISTRDIVLKAFAMQGAEQDATVTERFQKYLTRSLMVRERDGSVTGSGDYPRLWGMKKPIN